MVRDDKQSGVARGAALRQLRQRLGLTQAEVGRFAGLDQRSVSRLERGQRTGRAATWDKIQGALGFTDAVDSLIREGKS
jgi:transcriptional regulator with XRE-family HTH domain